MSDRHRHSYAHTENEDTYDYDFQEGESAQYQDEEEDWLQDDNKPHSNQASPRSESSQHRSCQASTLSASNTSKKPGVKGPKTFALPVNRASFHTVIADDTTLDDEGYPLLPNGPTTYVVCEDQKKPTNWGSFAFAYTTSGGGTHQGTATWRTVRYSCLGVIVCDNLECDYRGSPFTSRARRIGWEATWAHLLASARFYRGLG